MVALPGLQAGMAVMGHCGFFFFNQENLGARPAHLILAQTQQSLNYSDHCQYFKVLEVPFLFGFILEPHQAMPRGEP